MLLLLFSLFSYFILLVCNENGKDNFNNTQLNKQLRQSIREIDALLKDVRHEIQKGKSGLRTSTVDYEHETISDDGLLDYSVTNIWWNGTPGINYTGRNTPHASFLPTPQHHVTNEPIPKPNFPIPELPPQDIPHVPDHKYTISPTFETLDPYSLFTTPKSSPYPSFPDFSHLHSTPKLTPPAITRPTFPFSVPEFAVGGQYPPGHPLYGPPTYNDYGPRTSTFSRSDPDADRTFLSYHTAPFKISPSFTPEMSYQPGLPSLRPPGPVYTLYPGITPAPGVPTRYPPPPIQTYIPTTTSSPKPTSPRPILNLRSEKTVFDFSTMSNDYIKIWLHEKTKDSSVENWMVTLTMPSHNEKAPTSSPKSPELLTDFVTPPAKRGSQMGRTLSKAQAWVLNKHPKNNSKNQSPVIHRQGITVHVTPTQFGDSPYSTATGSQDRFFIEGPDGLLYVGTTPAEDENTKTTIVNGMPAYIPHDPTTASTAGDVFHGNFMVAPGPVVHPSKRYYDMMETLNEGYMMVFLLELTRLVTTKNETHVKQVIVHMELIMTGLFQTARIAWFGQPLINYSMKISMFLTEGPIDMIRTYAAMIRSMLMTRKTELSVEVNSIIDYADLLYEDVEGDLLFSTVKEFEDYPNITQTSRQLCESLLDNFLRPFRRLTYSKRRQALMDSINRALLLRFPTRRSNEEILPLSGVDKKTPTIMRNEKRHHRSHERNRTSKRNLKHRARRRTPSTHKMYRKQFSLGNEYTMMRRMKPITFIQKRFSIITPTHRFRGIKTQGDANLLSLSNRPTKDYSFIEKYRDPTQQTNALIKFFQEHDAYRTEDDRHGQSADAGRDESERHGSAVIDQKAILSFYQLLKNRLKKSEAQKKVEMLRKIVEDSSYSDEEASLKMNLIEALLYKNRTFENVDHSKDRQSSVEKTPVETEEEGALQRLPNLPVASLPSNEDDIIMIK